MTKWMCHMCPTCKCRWIQGAAPFCTQMLCESPSYSAIHMFTREVYNSLTVVQCSSARSIEGKHLSESTTQLQWCISPKHIRHGKNPLNTWKNLSWSHTLDHWINKHLFVAAKGMCNFSRFRDAISQVLDPFQIVLQDNFWSMKQPPPCWNGKWMTPWSASPRRVLRTNGWLGSWAAAKSRENPRERRRTNTHSTQPPAACGSSLVIQSHGGVGGCFMLWLVFNMYRICTDDMYIQS